MTRMTDEELADVAHRVADGRCHVCKGDRERIALIGCDACEGTGAFALSTETMCGVLMELIELRASQASTVVAANNDGQLRRVFVTGRELDALRDVGDYVRYTRGLERGSIALDRITRSR